MPCGEKCAPSKKVSVKEKREQILGIGYKVPESNRRYIWKNKCRWHKLYEIEQQINEHVSSIKSLLAQTSHTPTAVTFHML